ncbi:hypothetical protein RJT34_03150 [Clitoria ternatea]|uniref:Uncharacterized protein n=1 Tax=Clitoria ternatea TaxID=43366 RepID=A0AAN9KLP5_CLITE
MRRWGTQQERGDYRRCGARGMVDCVGDSTDPKKAKPSRYRNSGLDTTTAKRLKEKTQRPKPACQRWR